MIAKSINANEPIELKELNLVITKAANIPILDEGMTPD
jgi:hypothetical protein